MKTDVLIIGAGLAGLNTACRIAKRHPSHSILILTKGKLNECNSQLAQGGIAITTHTNNGLANHVEDTFIAGAKHTEKTVLAEILKDASFVEDQLKWYGVEFDRNEKGEFDRIKEGGHNEERILHVKDSTGASIMQKIREKVRTFPNIQLLEYYTAVELLVENNQCYGVKAANLINQEWTTILSTTTVIATGGIGFLYANSTNIPHSTGDGIALAYEKGATISDMEFTQFHPTALHQKEHGRFFLITEALRGVGAILLNSKGERFMEKYDERLELAPRDIVSRAITVERNKFGVVFLDCRHLSKDLLKTHFPMILEKCREEGIDLSKDLIPVEPVEHFLCGGIVTDQHGETAINNLFACGECARTGLHGANRLASNSLLEAMIMSERIAVFWKPTQIVFPFEESTINYTQLPSQEESNIQEMKKQVQFIMQLEGGIIRSNYGLTASIQKIEQLSKKWQTLFF